MRQIETPNGVEIKISEAPFKDAMKLKNAITKELSIKGIDLGKLDFKGIDLKTEISGDLIDKFITTAMSLDSSEAVNSALMSCMGRCLYKGESITERTFESPDAREDYYLIVFEVIKENLVPFFKGAVSGFKTLTKMLTA